LLHARSIRQSRAGASIARRRVSRKFRPEDLWWKTPQTNTRVPADLPLQGTGPGVDISTMPQLSRSTSRSTVWAVGFLGSIITLGASILPGTITRLRDGRFIDAQANRVVGAVRDEIDGAIAEAQAIGSLWVLPDGLPSPIVDGGQFGPTSAKAPKALFRGISVVTVDAELARDEGASRTYAIRMIRNKSEYVTGGLSTGVYLNRSLIKLGLRNVPTKSTAPTFAQVDLASLEDPQLIGEPSRFDSDRPIGTRATAWLLAVPVPARGWVIYDVAEDGLQRLVNAQPHGENLAVELHFGSSIKTKLIGAVRTDAAVGATMHRTNVLSGGGFTFSVSTSAKGMSAGTLPSSSTILFLGTLINAAVVTVLASKLRKRNITTLTYERDEALHLARTDSLTNLPNRLAVTEHLDAICADPNRGPITVLMGDLDRFKIVNDARGHDAGDQLLIEVGRRLQSLVPDQLVARLGGDEFVAVLQSVNQQQAAMIAEKFIDALRRPFTIGEDAVVVGISIGMVHVDHDHPTFRSQILTDADIAMYAAKRNGGNRVAMVDERLRRVEGGQLDLELGIRSALGTGQFETWYQPLVDANGDIRALEALVRWQHPERGLISPGNFLPAAKSAGLLGEISTAVLSQACTDVARWNRTRVANGHHPVVVHVNCVEEQLMDTSYADVVSAYLRMSQMDPAHLLLEVSEETAVEKLPKGLPTLQMIRALGVRFSLDDFGFGNSSLTMVRQLGDVAEIKLDKSIVDGLAPEKDAATLGGTGSTADVAVIKSVIEFAATQNILVVAEGIEYREQFEKLVGLGVDLFQGFHFYRPQPAETVELLLLDLAVPAPLRS
jgi:diguanylate cyclase